MPSYIIYNITYKLCRFCAPLWQNLSAIHSSAVSQRWGNANSSAKFAGVYLEPTYTLKCCYWNLSTPCICIHPVHSLILWWK